MSKTFSNFGFEVTNPRFGNGSNTSLLINKLRYKQSNITIPANSSVSIPISDIIYAGGDNSRNSEDRSIFTFIALSKSIPSIKIAQYGVIHRSFSGALTRGLSSVFGATGSEIGNAETSGTNLSVSLTSTGIGSIVVSLSLTSGSNPVYDGELYVYQGVGTFNTDTTPLLYEYPPIALTGSTAANTNSSSGISSQGYGNGTYVASSSTNLAGFAAHEAFDKNIDNSFWASSDGLYDATTGNYSGSVSTTAGSIGYPGEWLQLQLPNQIRLKYFTIQSTLNFETVSAPRSFALLASTTGSEWTSIYETSTANLWQAPQRSISFNTTNQSFYDYFRLVNREIGNTTTTGSNNTLVRITEMDFYGTTS